MQADQSPLARIGEVAREPQIESAIEAVRDVLGMEIAFSTHRTDSELILETVSAADDSFPVAPGARLPLEATYCHWMLEGELPNLMRDLREHPLAFDLELTRAADVGAVCTVPLVLSDGRVYGTLCCASHEAHPELEPHKVDFVFVLARIVADQIERCLRDEERRREQIESAAVEALLAAVEARDGYTGDHSRAVVDHAVAVARALGLPEREVVEVEHVALLHDVGKIGIPDAILHKPASLTDEEWSVMREHPTIGARVVSCLPGLERLVPGIRAEHERWDGAGYPDGLRGEQIPLASRIVFACDAYHAMTSDRPYRKALPTEVAIEELRSQSGRQFCPRVVDALLAVLGAAESLAA